MPTHDELHTLATAYAGIVSSGDVDAFVGLFTDDAVRADPVDQPPQIGKEAIRAFWRQTVESCKSLRFEVSEIHSAGNHVAFNFTVTVALEGATTVIRGIEVFEVADDGRIADVKAYWDDRDVALS